MTKQRIKAPAVTGSSDLASALDRLVADANAALEPVAVTLHGRSATVEIDIPHVLDWGVDAYPALERADLQGWARAALSASDFELWCQASPTLRQALDVFRQWTEATGEDPGESSASQPS